MAPSDSKLAPEAPGARGPIARRRWSHPAQFGAVLAVVSATLYATVALAPFGLDFTTWKPCLTVTFAVGVALVFAAIVRFFCFPVPPAWWIRGQIEQVLYMRGMLRGNRSQWSECLRIKRPMRIHQRRGYASIVMWIRDDRATAQAINDLIEKRTIPRVRFGEAFYVLDKYDCPSEWIEVRVWFTSPGRTYHD